MFGLAKERSVESTTSMPVTVAVAVPESQPVEITTPNQQVPAEYTELAKELGVTVVEDAKVIQQEKQQAIEKFFTDNGIRVYPYNKVMEFLRAQLPKKGQPDYSEFNSVVWVPLRKVDCGKVWSNVIGRYFDEDPYDKAVPYPALITAKLVADHFPAAKLTVSDYRAEVPDPFLMVTYADKNYVVEHWDEPGFLPFLNGDSK